MPHEFLEAFLSINASKDIDEVAFGAQCGKNNHSAHVQPEHLARFRTAADIAIRGEGIVLRTAKRLASLLAVEIALVIQPADHRMATQPDDFTGGETEEVGSCSVLSRNLLGVINDERRIGSVVDKLCQR